MSDLPILRTSERATFKRCPWRWLQEYEYGYRPISADADAAWLGIGIHEALAGWYLKGKRRGPHPARAFAEWAGEEIAYVKSYADETFDEGVWMDAKELGIAMLENYVDHYGKDTQWHIIATEEPFRITIKRNGKAVVIFQSRWDGVLRLLSDGRIYLLETKTTGQITLPYLEIDDQGGSYFAVASRLLRARGVLKPNEEIAGIIYNFIRRTPGDDRPQNEHGQYLNKPTKEHYVAALIGVDEWTESELRKLKVDGLESVAAANYIAVQGEVSKSQPPPPFVREIVERSKAEQRTQLDRIADEVQWMNAIRTGLLPVIKTPTKDCPRCPFWIPCQIDERGNYAEAESVMRSDYIQIDPYEDTRKSA
jgi:hypothetical protein